MTVEATHAVLLPKESTVRRNPPRPSEHRQKGYGAQFDDRTVFYDVLRASDHIRLVGPHLRNLAEDLQIQSVFMDGRDVTDRLMLSDSRTKVQDSMIRAVGELVVFSTGVGELSVPTSALQSERFTGRRVLHTLSQNNEIDWIRDWASYHVRHLGIDAITFYDNNSTAYAVESVADAFRTVNGLAEVAVVSWPFPYGPSGGPSQIWDSDYCQYGAFDHARWKFLQHAGFVLNLDIDELLVAQSRSQLKRELAQSTAGVVLFDGQWIDGAPSRMGRPRHRNYLHTREGDPTSAPKWVLDPSRAGDADWLVHEVRGVTPSRSAAQYRHFRAISNGWKYRRSASEPLDDHHTRDVTLERAMRRAGLLRRSDGAERARD